MDKYLCMDECNLCGSPEVQRFLEVGKNKYLERCRRCSLFFLNAEERNSAAEYCKEREVLLDENTLFQTSRVEFSENFFKNLCKKPGRLLDIGCGTGHFLSIAKKRGWDIQGVEISHQAAKAARAHYGLPVFEGDVEEAVFPEQTFDLITLWNVLDFLKDPKKVLSKIFRLLKKDGLLVLRVTNVRFHLGVYCFWHAIPFLRRRRVAPSTFHIYNFSETTLKSLLLSCGFVNVEVQNSSPTPGHPYEGSSFLTETQAKILKTIVKGTSALFFYGTFGRLCLGSSLLAQCWKK